MYDGCGCNLVMAFFLGWMYTCCCWEPAQQRATAPAGGAPVAAPVALAAAPVVVAAPPVQAVQMVQVAPKQTVQVQIPAGCGPGSQFQVNAGGRVVAVQVPPGACAGMTIAISV